GKGAALRKEDLQTQIDAEKLRTQGRPEAADITELGGETMMAAKGAKSAEERNKILELGRLKLEANLRGQQYRYSTQQFNPGTAAFGLTATGFEDMGSIRAATQAQQNRI